MRLLVFVTLFGVLLDAGKAPSWRDCGRFSGSDDLSVDTQTANKNRLDFAEGVASVLPFCSRTLMSEQKTESMTLHSHRVPKHEQRQNKGDALQIQCYQCEEMKHNDCSTPEYIVNCTVNVQDTCQKEVLVKPDGIHYRKSCASSGACLIASSGYQQFCTGNMNSVCISCCSTPLCNGPRKKRPIPSAAAAGMRMDQAPSPLPDLLPAPTFDVDHGAHPVSAVLLGSLEQLWTPHRLRILSAS
ncbi:Ly6/PLAUR domain-containing protein 1 [Larimichthys crocea]|uniref:Uncharacterized protein n=1 Tax=Larimichthys crocea TaxID=215358 RepID=A0ACD3QXX2_LARCR|nr:Ly6/PLAUR domain-containing protein 1 [Larimichthys crocea]